MAITGAQYADRIAHYLARRFGARGLEVYREVPVGKTIIGKNRRIDIFCLLREKQEAFAIECKYQDSAGTVDEKIPYALDDLRALPMNACMVYAGSGFSEGVLHLLRASSMAAFCLPEVNQTESTEQTRELDHLMALHFRWWDLFVANKKAI